MAHAVKWAEEERMPARTKKQRDVTHDLWAMGQHVGTAWVGTDGEGLADLGDEHLTGRLDGERFVAREGGSWEARPRALEPGKKPVKHRPPTVGKQVARAELLCNRPEIRADIDAVVAARKRRREEALARWLR